ncbi:WD40-repeat-containing domain protein [Lipomyces japonicus]|uniref:WD40-repeat-containing domain protein n=1 Tax=Lipomyces japonicus TaxID=56871 RepID=UPI0034CD7106
MDLTKVEVGILNLRLNAGIDFVQVLPEELNLLIFAYLDDIRTLLACSAVSAPWHDIANSQRLWRRKFRDEPNYNCKPTGDKIIDWKELYKTRFVLERRWMHGIVEPSHLVGHEDSVYCVQFDDIKIVTGSRDQTIRVWSTTDHSQIQVLRKANQHEIGHDGSILCLQYDEKLMVSGSSDSTCILWRLPGFIPFRQLTHHSGAVLDVAIYDRIVATCSKDGFVCVLDRDQEFETKFWLPACRGPVNAIDLKHNVLVSAGNDGLVKIWNTKSGKLIKTLIGHKRSLACVQISDDLKFVVSGGNDDSIRIWDAKRGTCLRVLQEHQSLVRSLQLSGNKLISASYDKSIKIWSMETFRLMLDFSKFHGSWIFAAKTDGKRIVSTSFGINPVILDFSQGLNQECLAYLCD